MPFFPPQVSGAGKYLADVADGFLVAGHRVTVLVGHPDRPPDQLEGLRIESVVGRVHGATSALMVWRALAIHHEDPVDVVISGLAYPTGVVGAVVSRALRR